MAIGAMGSISVSEDLKILDDMPSLPSVDIVLVTGVEPHPILDKECLTQLVESMA
jgi:hypothetical protein